MLYCSKTIPIQYNLLGIFYSLSCIRVLRIRHHVLFFFLNTYSSTIIVWFSTKVEWYFSLLYECYFVRTSARSREIENIWGTRVILFGKNIVESRRVDRDGNVISNRPTFERIAARVQYAGFGPSDVYITVVLSDFSPPM